MFNKTTTVRYCHVDTRDYFCMKTARSPLRNNCNVSCQNGSKNKAQVYAVYKKPTLNTKIHTDASKGMEKNTPSHH